MCVSCRPTGLHASRSRRRGRSVHPHPPQARRGLARGKEEGVAVRDYELTFVLSTTLDEDASAAAVERVNQLIVTGGGSLTEVHAWGKRRLAYPIAHQRDGLYITTRFSLPGGAVGMLDNDLRLNEHILRHLIVRQDEVPIRPVLPQAQGAG